MYEDLRAATGLGPGVKGSCIHGTAPGATAGVRMSTLQVPVKIKWYELSSKEGGLGARELSLG